MSRSSQDPSHQLAYARACGFCGRMPTLVWLPSGRHFVVGCESSECNAQPRTEPREDAGEDERAFEKGLSQAVDEWNGHARHQLRMLG